MEQHYPIGQVVMLGARKSVQPIVQTRALDNLGIEELDGELGRKRNERHLRRQGKQM